MDIINSINEIDFLNKYSSDKSVKKIREDLYVVEIQNEKRYLIKILPISAYDKILSKKKKVDILISMGREIYPILDIGVIKQIDKSYKITDYIDTITRYESEEKNYQLGRKIGRIIKDYHILSNRINNKTWVRNYTHKINILFHEYYLCEYIGEKDYIILDYIKNNKNLLFDRDVIEILSFKNIRDIPVDKDGKIFLFDIEEREEADPFFEFKDININYYNDEPYSAGIIDGYFNGKPNRLFFKTIALYTLVEALSKEFEDYKKVNYEIAKLKTLELLEYYNDFENIYPKWYLLIKEKLKRD